PFVVPLRPTMGSLMEDLPPPAPEYCESVYRRVVPYLTARGLGARGVAAGCAWCQACSAMSLLEDNGDNGRRTYLPPITNGWRGGRGGPRAGVLGGGHRVGAPRLLPDPSPGVRTSATAFPVARGRARRRPGRPRRRLGDDPRHRPRRRGRRRHGPAL